MLLLVVVDLLLLVFAVVQGMQAPTKCECENSMHGQSIHIQYIPTTMFGTSSPNIFFIEFLKILGTNSINWY